MKYSVFLALIASAQAVKLSQDYVEYGKLAPPIWSVIKRGAVRDFADSNVEKAMKANPTSGDWPVAPAPKPTLVEGSADPHYAKQPWEGVVKKGNSAFNDLQVEKAMKLIPEPQAVNGVILPAGGIAGDAEAAAKVVAEKQEKEQAAAQALVPDEKPKAGETPVAAFPAEAVPAEAAPAAAAAAPAEVKK